MTAEKSMLEEKFWRSQVASATFEDLCKSEIEFNSDKDALDRTMKETIIKLFAVSLFKF